MFEEIIAEYDFRTTQFNELFTTELGDDGTVNQVNGSVELLSSAFNQTETMGQTGVMDHFKLVGCSRRGLELCDHHTTAVTVDLSWNQLFHQGTPVPMAFADKIKNRDADYRLGCGGFFLYYPDIDVVQGVLITNDMLYVVHGVLGLRGVAALAHNTSAVHHRIRKLFASSPYDTPQTWTGADHLTECIRYVNAVPHNPDEHCSLHQASFMAVVAVLRRETDHPIDDYHSITLEVNPRRSVFRWLIDGELCHTHHGIGRRPCDTNQCVVHRGGSNSKVCPRRAYLMTGTFTMLDHLRDNCSLVALCGTHVYRHPVKGNGCYLPLCDSSFAIVSDIPSMRIFGQGACLSLRRIRIERYRDPGCWSHSYPVPQPKVSCDQIELPDWQKMVSQGHQAYHNHKIPTGRPISAVDRSISLDDCVQPPMPLLLDRSYMDETSVSRNKKGKATHGKVPTRRHCQDWYIDTRDDDSDQSDDEPGYANGNRSRPSMVDRSEQSTW